MRHNNLLNKTMIRVIKVAIITFVTTSTLTACNFETKVNTPNFSENMSVEIMSTINDTIDETNFSNEAAVDSMNETVTEALNQVGVELQKAKLVRVVDGDTIVVEIDNEQQKVRLIGVDTPESVASDEYLNRTGKVNSIEGKNASDYTKEVLKNIEYVYLQRDVSETDRYGRLLRFVWVEMPIDATNKEEIANKMLNGILLSDHVANVATYKPDVSLADTFEEIYTN